MHHAKNVTAEALPKGGSRLTGQRNGFEYLFQAAAGICGLLVVGIFFFLLFFGLPLLQQGELTTLLTTDWAPDQGLYGIRPMIKASLLLSTLALGLGLPISLGLACAITSLAPPRLRQVLLYMVRLMTSIPTVVYSFAALFLLVPLMRWLLANGGLSLLTAAPVLALLITPTITLFLVNSFFRVPRSTVLAADALGASSAQKLLLVILPASLPGLINGSLLGFGRALGDTMVSLMLAGNSVAPNADPTAPARTLTAHIALVMAADFDSLEFKSIFVCGLVLYTITALLTAGLRLAAGTGDNHANPS